MNKYLLYTFFFISASITSCKTNQHENSQEVALDYCNCLEEQMKNAVDSSVNIYDCEKTVFSKSRLLTIEMSEKKGQYSMATRDSAFNFLIQTGNIIDTLCLKKINWKKVKKVPHVRM